MTPEIISDRYQVRQQLGKKAGRRTLLAYDLQTENLVVIKILNFSPDFEWENLKLFEREAKILQNLSHQFIPDYLDYFELDSPKNKGFALVQTYIEAKSLEQHRIAGLNFTETEIKQLAQSLLEILIYLHQHQPAIVHRDIKPSNILLTNRSGHSVGEVYLVDFGSVQNFAATEGGTFTIVGTYGYMPPEQFGGRAVPASDLYSLGATLVYLLTGKHPADLPQQNLRLQFEKFTNLSPSFSHWLKQMIEPSLDNRFSSAKEALSALKNPQTIKSLAVNKNRVVKPVNSQLECYRYPDRIEIQYPQPDFYLAMLPKFVWCFLSLLILFFFIASPSFLLLSVLFLVIVSSFFRLGLYIPNRDHKVIRIERNKLIEGYGSENNKHILLQSKFHFKTIDLIAYHPGYSFDKFFDETGKRLNRGKVEIKPKLSIYIDNREYLIGNGRLSAAELWWLGHALSDFLDVELQVIP